MPLTKALDNIASENGRKLRDVGIFHAFEKRSSRALNTPEQNSPIHSRRSTGGVFTKKLFMVDLDDIDDTPELRANRMHGGSAVHY